MEMLKEFKMEPAGASHANTVPMNAPEIWLRPVLSRNTTYTLKLSPSLSVWKVIPVIGTDQVKDALLQTIWTGPSLVTAPNQQKVLAIWWKWPLQLKNWTLPTPMSHGLLSMMLTQPALKTQLLTTWSDMFAPFTPDLRKLLPANDCKLNHY